MPSPTQQRGALFEVLAERRLLAEGYEIIERNWRCGRDEIDRIAYEDDILCFVEVRARRSAEFGHPDETVDRNKQRRIVRGARAYLMRFPAAATPMVRFDVVSIIDRGDAPPEIELTRNAFDAGR